jgi:hypothetical protein
VGLRHEGCHELLISITPRFVGRPVAIDQALAAATIGIRLLGAGLPVRE